MEAEQDGMGRMEDCVELICEFLQSKSLLRSESLLRAELEKSCSSESELMARNLFTSRLEELMGVQIPKRGKDSTASLVVDMTPVCELDTDDQELSAIGGCARALQELGTERANKLNVRTKLFDFSRATYDEGTLLRTRRGRGTKAMDRQIVFHDGAPMTEEHKRSIAHIALPVLYNPHIGGLEDSPEVDLSVGTLVAQRYRVVAQLGKGSFSRVVQCLDLRDKRHVAVKVLRNDKDCTDQGLAEVRLLAQLSASDRKSEVPLVRMLDFFYHKEHLMVVTELLRDSLLEFYRYLNAVVEPGGASTYFTPDTLGLLASQLLVASAFLHERGITHCDIKPENVCVVSASRRKFKLIDLGSAVFDFDSRNSYVQSRWYRAPEVMLGLPWDHKVDVWGVGCVIAEVVYGQPIFYGRSVETVLASHQAALGPFPEYMRLAPLANSYFTRDGDIFTVDPPGLAAGAYYVLPHQTSLRELLEPGERGRTPSPSMRGGADEADKEGAERTASTPQLRAGKAGGGPHGGREGGADDDREAEGREAIISLLGELLCLDPTKRSSAAEALESPRLRSFGGWQGWQAAMASPLPHLLPSTFQHSPASSRPSSRPLSPAGSHVSSRATSPSQARSNTSLAAEGPSLIPPWHALNGNVPMEVGPRGGSSIPRTQSLKTVQEAARMSAGGCGFGGDAADVGRSIGRRNHSSDGPCVPEEFRNSLHAPDASPSWSQQFRHKFARMLSGREGDSRRRSTKVAASGPASQQPTSGAAHLPPPLPIEKSASFDGLTPSLTSPSPAPALMLAPTAEGSAGEAHCAPYGATGQPPQLSRPKMWM